MAYIQLDEHTDNSLRVQLDGNRIRIRYGVGASITLDTEEALDLVVEVVDALLEIEPGPRDPIDPMRSVKASGVLNYIDATRRELAEFIRHAREAAEQKREAGL